MRRFVITSTHAVVNAIVATRLPHSGLGDLLRRRSAMWFVVGGVAPDLPGLVLTVGAFIYYPMVKSKSAGETFRLITEDLFFNSPLWIAAHNSLHSPVLLITGFAVARRFQGRGWLAARSLLAGAGLHTLLDIPVHHDDGPLSLFPFNWDFRVQSPVSYWDPKHYGEWVRPIDIGISVIGALLLARKMAR